MNKKTARIDGRGNVSRTCGFCVVPTESLQPLTRLAYDALMFIGGAPGSAAAGMKVTTFAVLIYTLTAMCRNERETVIDQLLAVCAEYTNATKRIITFEYTVIRGGGDSRAFAEELARQVRRVPMAKVNLIPLSPVAHCPDFRTSDEGTLLMFLDVLMKNRVQTMLRRSRECGFRADGKIALYGWRIKKRLSTLMR